MAAWCICQRLCHPDKSKTMATTTVPVPADALRRAQDSLAPMYGSDIWEQDGRRVLMIRVPNDDPDPVNDLEYAADYLSPGDVRGITHCVLLGHKKMHAVYTQPVRDIMARRVAFDQDQCIALRREMDPHAAKLYAAAKDPRRLLRVALRLPKNRVQDLDDEDLDNFADHLAAEFEEGRIAEARCVYIIADANDVRLDPDLFLPDLKQRFEAREKRRQILAKAEVTKKEREERTLQDRARNDLERKRLLRDLEKRFGETEDFERRRRTERVVRAPVRAPARAPESAPVRDREARDRMDPLWEDVRATLEDHGYEVLIQPQVPGHEIDMAAERAEGPAKVLVRISNHLDTNTAEKALFTARALGADLALLVAETATAEAQRALVATKGTWVAPRDLGRLSF